MRAGGGNHGAQGCHSIQGGQVAGQLLAGPRLSLTYQPSQKLGRATGLVRGSILNDVGGVLAFEIFQGPWDRPPSNMFRTRCLPFAPPPPPTSSAKGELIQGGSGAGERNGQTHASKGKQESKRTLIIIQAESPSGALAAPATVGGDSGSTSYGHWANDCARERRRRSAV